MDLELNGKVALVSGGAEGIGEAIVRTLAAEGVMAVIIDRNREKMEVLVSEIIATGGRADSIFAELTDEQQVEAAVQEVIQRHGGIDLVVNNAGANDGIGIEGSVDAFRTSLDKNLVHCFSVVHFALDALKESRGCIVNIGSKVAETGQGGTSGYAASKGALNSLTREWALDLAPHGIRVNCVVPAEVMTPLYRRWLDGFENAEEVQGKIEESIPFEQRMTTAKEIADTVVFVASPRSSHTTGQILYVDGGYTHFDRKCSL